MPIVHSVFATVEHENNSQGVLYNFVQGARRWKERQTRILCVGGELHGQRLTRWEISQSKWPNSYRLFLRQSVETPVVSVWAFINC